MAPPSYLRASPLHCMRASVACRGEEKQPWCRHPCHNVIRASSTSCTCTSCTEGCIHATTGQTDKPTQAEQSPHVPGCSQCLQLLPFPMLSPASTLSTLLFRGLQINSQTLLEEFKPPSQGGGWQLFLDESPWAGGSLASSDNQ